jgi:hypothetical protein
MEVRDLLELHRKRGIARLMKAKPTRAQLDTMFIYYAGHDKM